MKDRYEERASLEKLADWTETSGAREMGYKLQRGLGALAVVVAVPLTIKGIWDHDYNEIMLGVAGTLNGNFLATYGHMGLQKVRSESNITVDLE